MRQRYKLPLIAEPMYLNGTIERVGSGTRDIVKLCKKWGLKEPEYIQEEFFRLILWRRDLASQDAENFTENFTENLNNIVALMKNKPSISFDELSEKIGISRRAIINNINKLKKLGVLERVGADKGGYWKIIEKFTSLR